jgi:hypothetical protein
MPFEHIVDHDTRLVVVRGNGEGSVEETIDSARRLLEDQSIHPNYHFMFVVDDIALYPTTVEMSRIAFLLETLLSRFKGRMAIVTSRVGRVTTAHLIANGADNGNERLRAFIWEAEARKWLAQAFPS